MPTSHYTCFACGLPTATQKGRRCRSCMKHYQRTTFGVCACGRTATVKHTGLCDACRKLKTRSYAITTSYRGSPRERQDFLKLMDGLVEMLRQYRKPYAEYLRYTKHELVDRKRPQAVIAAETLLILAQDTLPEQHLRYLLWRVNKDAPAGERLPNDVYKGNGDA